MFKNVSKEEIIIPATMASLREVREFIEQIGKKHKFSDKITNSFKLVVDESCTNIIRHGYQEVKNGTITIRAIIRRLSLTIIIIDHGKSFDPRQVQNPDLEKYVQIGKKGGLGIFMMRKLMDDIQYNITSHGNELRLTKMREALEQPFLLSWFSSQSLRRKAIMGTVAFILVLAVFGFIYFSFSLTGNIREQVFAESAAGAREFARLNWNPLRTENDILLFENAKSFQESRRDKIHFVLVTNANYEVTAVYPVNSDLAYKRLDFSSYQKLGNRGGVEIYQGGGSAQKSYYFFVSPIQLTSVDPQPIGYAVLWLDEGYINQLVSAARLKNFVITLIILVLGAGIIVFVVTQVTRPFHKLAEWVRQVGRGQLDQDEIDIDARDELGEIAQAFNEMTGKFRQAQLTVIEQQRLKKELQVAQEIQQMLLPDDFPEVAGYDIASYYQSAKEVGGDLFDFTEVDDQGIGICVADVSGKGIPGSLVMTMIRTSLRLETRGNKNPAEILAKVNQFVTDDIRKGMFVTMLYVILDSRERMVSFASAGHNPMILYRGKSKETYYLNPSGFPVGITLPDINLFAQKIQADRIRLHPDDIFILYTDGITEAMNAQRELYGEERFLAAIRRFGHLDVVEFVKSIKDDILSFTGGVEQNDDITLVAIKENMAAVDVKVNAFKQLFEQVQADNQQTVAEACREAGISSTTYYRYRRIYEEGGYDLLREMLHGYTNLGLRHLSIEVKTKMYDIIRKTPAYGPKKISDTLNSEPYGYTEVSPALIYEELKRAKLNTRQRREAFVARGGKQRLKPPGTPLLTLDGEVMVGFRSEPQKKEDMPFMPHIPDVSRSKAKIMSARGKRLPGLDDELENALDEADLDLPDMSANNSADEPPQKQAVSNKSIQDSDRNEKT